MLEVVATTGTGASQVRKELENLTRVGLVLREPRCNEELFRANPESPVFPEIKSLVAKIFGIVDVVRESRQPFAWLLGTETNLVTVYGNGTRQSCRRKAA